MLKMDSALQRQLKIKRSILEEKLEHVVVGEALVVDIDFDFMKLEEVITKARCEVLVLEDEEKVVQKQLENMKKMSGR
jgi:hypothetical protein